MIFLLTSANTSNVLNVYSVGQADSPLLNSSSASIVTLISHVVGDDARICGPVSDSEANEILGPLVSSSDPLCPHILYQSRPPLIGVDFGHV